MMQDDLRYWFQDHPSAQDWYYWLREVTLCNWGKHSAPSKRVQKFNGGRGAQLCCYCRIIMKYGFEK
jgi:hypothetical protein